MAKFQVWYKTPESFRYYGADPNALTKTHVHLKDVEIELEAGENGLEAVWVGMQGENWSPNGEARDLIRSKGLGHTSMSVGDVLVDEDSNVHLVKSMGFKNIGRIDWPTENAGRAFAEVWKELKDGESK